MACKRCEISTFIKDNGVDLFFLKICKIKFFVFYNVINVIVYKYNIII